MSTTHRTHTRADVAEVIATVAGWEPPGGHSGGTVHAGDLGWFLRMPDAEIEPGLHSWWDGPELVAVAIVEGAVARPRISPDRLADPQVAQVLADAVDSMLPPQAWTDAQQGSAFRSLLLDRGWTTDPDPWVMLHLTFDGTPVEQVPGVAATGDAVEDRVVVQRNGFEGSTFTAGAWARMAAGPGFDASLDLVARDEKGVPVAVATAWSAGPGRHGLLEPVATHRDHRGAGHGRRVVRAAMRALAEAGATGVSVATPQSNAAAVSLYLSAGMEQVEVFSALTRGGD